MLTHIRGNNSKHNLIPQLVIEARVFIYTWPRVDSFCSVDSRTGELYSNKRLKRFCFRLQFILYVRQNLTMEAFVRSIRMEQNKRKN